MKVYLVKRVNITVQVEVIQGDRCVHLREFTTITVTRVSVEKEETKVGVSQN